MSQMKPLAFATEKETGGLPDSPRSGYEPVYRSTQRPKQPRRIGWCEDALRNRPQWTSLAAATFIFTSGGFNLASSIGFESRNTYGNGTHIQFCWFIAVIIGACISTSLVHKISKRVFNLVASVLVIIGGVFHIVATQSTSAVLSARYCDGFAFGITLIPAILAGSEQSVKRFRGLVLSVEQIGLVAGAMLKILYTEGLGNNTEHKPNHMHGVLAVICGLVALILTFIFTLESPVFLLYKDNEDEAVHVLRKLQKPKTVTNETYSLLNECKALLRDDMNRESSNFSSSFIPMIKMILFRSFVAMSFSYPLTLTFTLATSLSSRNGIPVGFYVYVLMRLIGVTFSTFFLDTVGRRIPSTLALLFGGGILFGVGWLASSFHNSHNAYIQPVIFLMLVYQMLSGIMAPTSTCYLGEAFSISVKPYFILAVVIIENILQIMVCILVTDRSISNFACALGGSQFFYATIFFFTMPETMQTTLREALKLFKKVVVVRPEPEEEEGGGEESAV